MKIIKMNTSQIEKLIDLVSKYPQLYDSNHVEYADQYKRELIWVAISKELNLTADLCRAKWTILRSGYRKALRNSRVYNRKKWRFEDNMNFLKDCIQNRRFRRSFESKPGDASDDEDDAILDIKAEQSDEVLQEDDKTSSCDSLKQFQINQERSLERSADKDAVTHFFLSMAGTVKSLPLLTQAQIKAEVFRCVNDAEIKYLQDRN